MLLHRLTLTTSYIIAFSILAMWAVFGFLTMNSLIDSQEKFASLINLSGKQRMLSQRTALLSSKVYADKNEENLILLRESVSLMQAEHKHIIAQISSERMHEIYFATDGLDAKVSHYFQSLDLFVHLPTLENLHTILIESEQLLPYLNDAVYAFEKQSDMKTQALQNREFFIFVGTLLTLFLEALLIIRPVVRFMNNHTELLEREVEKRTKDMLIFANIFENSTEGMVITDADEKIVEVNNAFSKITGYSRDEALGNTPRILQSKKHDVSFYNEMWSQINEQGIWQGEIINQAKSGQFIYEHLTIMKLESQEQNVNYVSIFSDITERIKDQEKLHDMATTDVLTGLPNRIEIISIIEHAIKLSEHMHHKLAVIYIDIDNFKIINDAMNHSMGDLYLIEVAKRLSSTLRESDTISRLGGDEFIILVESIKKSDEVFALLTKIRAAIQEPITINDKDFFSTASFGIVIYPDVHIEASEESCNAKGLMRKAELAMYSAKENGKNQMVYYNETLDERIQSKLLVDTQLRDAIKNDELELFFQPKIELATSHITGAEALIRWKKEGKYIFPNQFIPVAEESNLIVEIDFWVCRKSIEILKSLHAKGNMVKLSLNISARTFTNEDAMQEYMSIIHQSNIAAYLDIEITENILVNNLLEASNRINEIKNCGATVALDDFGTGYSSLSYLSRLSFDSIKIDRSFVMGMDDPKQKVLIDAILSFSKKLGIKITAEGIETVEQLSWLREHQCDEGQGYYFSKAVPVDEFKKILNKKILD